jgi:exopolyphosphatase/guanosine-5'-triphosphate,3'-diphosphate pyrophosphatase
MDVGSNSLHMVVAQVDAAGGVTVLWRAREMVGLGRMSFPSRRLSREAIERAMVTLRRFSREAKRWQCEKWIGVATSAVREATNGGVFIARVRRELGVHVRVISAREEARLIYLGVRQAIDLSAGPHLIVDIGGGSAEFIVASGEGPLMLESRKLGAARMTAQYVKSDPVNERELKSLRAHYGTQLSPLMAEAARHKPTRFIGTSGAMENLVALCARPEDVAGVTTLRAVDLDRLVETLTTSSSADRAKMRGLDDKRRDQILAAAVLVQEVFRRTDVQELQLCRSALREGILADYLARHRPELETLSQAPDPRRRAVLDLGRRCHWHREHAEQVAILCIRLFDQLQPLHGLGDDARELIAYGALLHDIGSLIERSGHHKHSAYLIKHNGLAPLTDEEVQTVAAIARYHRKTLPTVKHHPFRKLSERARRITQVGAALLRVADGLDRTNGGVVHGLRCRVLPDCVQLRVDARGDAELEIWSAQARSKLFEKVFGRRLVVRPVTRKG